MSVSRDRSLIALPRSRSRAASRAPAERQRPSKRLILCEDGTWLNSDAGNIRGELINPSNVTRISRAIKPRSSDGIPQVVYYHFGVGASGGIVDRIYGGISGEGLAEIVREGYSFISTNYLQGDEIFLFGFSRGAFTARSIAGLIGVVGVLTKDGLPYLAEIFRDVQHRHDDDYRPRNPDIPFPNKPSALDPAYAQELQRRGLTRLRIPIKVVGVWDTVGSLGTPKVGWLQRVGLQSSASKYMAFYDTSLSDSIENAFQALALDERRFSFQPALWEKNANCRTKLRQVWFPGAHSNVGGGYDDQQIANISLAWMMSQCQSVLDFDPDYILDMHDKNLDYYDDQKTKIRPWSFGEIFSGMTGFYALGGSKIRTPGRYYAVDPTNGEPTDRPLKDTCEYIHPSVRTRLKLGGPGLNDNGKWECKALKDWKLNVEYGDPGSKRPDVFWKLKTRERNVSHRVLREAPLWELERELLEDDPETYDYVMSPSPVRQRKSARSRVSLVASRRGNG